MKASKLAGFDDSLRLLIQVERYSLTDAGLMFGMTRQAMHQACIKRGIVHPDGNHRRGLRVMRVWDDETNSFVPQTRPEVRREQARVRVAALREARRQTLQWRRNAIVEAVRGLDRIDPSWREVWYAIGGGLNDIQPHHAFASYVLGWWGGTGSAKQRLAEFRAATGTIGRPVGSPRMRKAS
jgi:hypothetical protein